MKLNRRFRRNGRRAHCARSAIAALCIAAAVGAAGCGGADVELYLAEVVPFGDSAVATEVIFPGPAAAYLLGDNWPPLRAAERSGIWVHGTWAELGFYAAIAGDHTLLVRARPYDHADAPTQIIRLELNGEEILAQPMQQGWHDYEFELPAGGIEYGWNDLTFRFRQSIRPADYDPESGDRRNLAAQFRGLAIRAPNGREPLVDTVADVALLRPGGSTADVALLDDPLDIVEIVDDVEDEPAGMAPVETDPDEAGDDSPEDAVEGAASDQGDEESLALGPPPDPAATTIAMRTDSFFELVVAPRSDTRLSGVVNAAFDADSAGEIHAVIEMQDEAATRELFAATFEPAGDLSAEADVGLGDWAGELVRLRVRVTGSATGTVSWTHMGMSTPLVDTSLLPDAPGQLVEPPRSGLLGRSDVIFILMDAARYDSYSGELGAEIAPTITALAAEGTRFDAAWSPSSWTGQTMPALLTGMTPDAVGMEHWGSRLPEPVINFPELLMEADYHTVLWSQHNIYRSNSTLRRGFATFTEVRSDVLEDRELLPAADELFVDDKPTFALIHLLPPHAPYEPPAPFHGSRSSWSNAGFDISAPRLNKLDDEISSSEELAEITRYARDRYDENVAYVDHLVGRLLQTFRDAGRYDDALIVVLADHGEAFNEHGRFLHTRWLFEEFIHVPLVVKWPASTGGFAGVVDEPVILVDLAPTLIDALGIDDERARYNGRSLLPMVFDGAAPDRILYAYTRGNATPTGRARPEYSLRWGDLKLRYNSFDETITFVDLGVDPGELADAGGDHPVAMRYLRQALQLARYRNTAFLASVGNASFESLDPETIAKLKALGYLQ